MKLLKLIIALGLISSLSGCIGFLRQGEEYLAYNEEALFGIRNTFGDRKGDKTTDVGLIDRSPLSNMTAGIWIDPNGCQHWIIDDGVEGYLDVRIDPASGRVVCNQGDGEPNYAYGNFKIGATRIIGDTK